MAKLKKQSSLSVSWSSAYPPVPARRWMPVEPDRRLPSDRRLESACGLPERTLAWLRGAFKAGLTRNEGWITSDDPAARMAARLYKRGVASRPETQPPILSAGTYSVTVIRDAFRPHELGTRAIFLVDHRVAAKWSHLGFPPDRTIIVRTSESRKSLATVGEILEQSQAITQRLRGSTWYLVGGGILGDLGGFAASLANCPFVQVPTTLLAMVDSSVGGKTGVNFAPYGKNQVGAFAFPQRVLIYPDFLTTLPLRHLRGGAAECLKHGMLVKESRLLDQTSALLGDEDWKGLASSLLELVEVKARIVDRDPMEAGERAVLNLGHTLAHALEAESHSRVSPTRILEHGEAVGFGLLFALILSEVAGVMKAGESLSLCQAIFDANILPAAEELEVRVGRRLTDRRLFHALYRHILNDKKRTSQSNVSMSQWVLLEKRGKVCKIKPGSFLTPVDRAILETCWKRFIDELPRGLKRT